MQYILARLQCCYRARWWTSQQRAGVVEPWDIGWLKYELCCTFWQVQCILPDMNQSKPARVGKCQAWLNCCVYFQDKKNLYLRKAKLDVVVMLARQDKWLNWGCGPTRESLNIISRAIIMTLSNWYKVRTGQKLATHICAATKFVGSIHVGWLEPSKWDKAYGHL